jgi:hypothetical protein
MQPPINCGSINAAAASCSTALISIDIILDLLIFLLKLLYCAASMFHALDEYRILATWKDFTKSKTVGQRDFVQLPVLHNSPIFAFFGLFLEVKLDNFPTRE